MKPAPFRYLRPTSTEEACHSLARYGEEARILAGGQSLGAMLNMRLVTPRVLIDVNRVDGLAEIEVSGDTVVTGAVVRQADALADPRIRARIPLLAMALPHVGHYQTRNRGTLGGSVAHADPSAEVPLVLATLGGKVELRSAHRSRCINASDFFRSALVTTRAPDELIVALHWPAANSRTRHGFTEFSVRGGDYAIVAAACLVEDDANGRLVRVRLGYGGCGEMPQVLETSEAVGRLLDDALADHLARDAAERIACRSDLQASAEYRRHLAVVLGQEVLNAAKRTEARA